VKIFDEGDFVRLQLRDNEHNVMLFDFKVKKETYPELREHMMAALEAKRV